LLNRFQSIAHRHCMIYILPQLSLSLPLSHTHTHTNATLLEANK
jgi:hypothetical protein